MPMIRVDRFAGEWPKRAGEKLPDGFAQKAVNVDLSTGMLRGFYECGSSTLPPGTLSALFFDASRTFTWAQDVDATKSPMTNSVGDRFYWAGGDATGVQMHSALVAQAWKQKQIAAGQSPHLLPTTTSFDDSPESWPAPANPAPAIGATKWGSGPDFVGVPRPWFAPMLAEVLPVIGHLVAHFELSLANERVGGALTELTPLTVGNSADATSNYNVDPLDEDAVTTLMQSVTYAVNPRATEYVLAKPGPNAANDILRQDHAHWRMHGTNASWGYSGLVAMGAPTPRGKFYIGGSARKNDDGTWAHADAAIKTPVIENEGVAVDAYYADDISTLYFRAPRDLATGDYIENVVCPFLATDGANYFDMKSETMKPLNGAAVTFKRCTPRDTNKDARTSWYYFTSAYSPASADRRGNIGTLDDHASIAYKVSLSPVIANDSDGPGALDSLGPVVVMDAWLAERDQPTGLESGGTLLTGTLTGAGYAAGATGAFVDDVAYRWMEEGDESTPGTRAYVRSKLTKVRAIFRLDGKHTIPEQLSAVTSHFALPNMDAVPNSSFMRLTAGAVFYLSMQTKYETTEARGYVYTFVNEFGEEGPPSDPLLISDIPKDGRIRLNLSAMFWDRYRYAPIRKIRLYRTATGSTNTDFLFADEFDLFFAGAYSDPVKAFLANAGVLVKADGVTPANKAYPFITERREYIRTSARQDQIYQSGAWITLQQYLGVPGDLGMKHFVHVHVGDFRRADELGEPLATQNYYPPPRYGEGLGAKPQGLCQMHNGMHAFFEGSNVWLSEPYLPYAYDPSAVQTLPFEVVAICPTENYLFVTTKGDPFILTGSTPQTITNRRVVAPSMQSGVSKNSVVATGDGIVYASRDGLVRSNGAVASMELSSSLFSRKAWTDYWPGDALDNMTLAIQDNYLMAFGFSAASGGKALIIDMGSPGETLTRYSSTNDSTPEYGSAVRAAMIDPYGDVLHLSSAGTVGTLFAGSTRGPWRYMTRRFELPKPASMAVLQIVGAGTVTARVFHTPVVANGDGAEVLLSEVTLDLDATNWTRLPAAGVSRFWAVELIGAVGAEVSVIALATSMIELQHG